MAELRAHFEALDVTRVETFIASGNVLFDTRVRTEAALERRIEAGLHEALGYEVPVFVRSLPELAELVARPPYRENRATDGDYLSVGFLKVVPDDAARARAESLRSELDHLKVDGRALWWRRRGESRLTLVQVERALGSPATFRALSSVSKLLARHPPG